MVTGLRRNSLLFVTFAAALFAGLEVAAEPPVHARIDSIAPSVLDPNTGQIVTVQGEFHPPVRLFFDLGSSTGLWEALVMAASETSITAVALPVDLGPLGWRTANVIVVASAGTVFEQRATLTNGVRFERRGLLPSISTVSPRSVPRTGGARVTFFGGVFEAPVQAFAIHEDGTESEMQVIAVRFDQLTVLASGAENDESVGVRVVNLGTGKTATFPNAFRYVAPMSIVTVSPSIGPYGGGTRVTIEGSGLTNPTYVAIGGVAAQLVEVTDNRIVALTGARPEPQCSDHTDVVEVINSDGLYANGPPFTFTTPRTEFRFVPSQAIAGSLVSVIVKEGEEGLQFHLNDTPVVAESHVDNGDGSTTYRLRVPANLLASARDCRPAPQAMTLQMTSVGSGCRDARPLFILPAHNVESCRPPREVP